jgi:hypothetical protein
VTIAKTYLKGKSRGEAILVHLGKSVVQAVPGKGRAILPLSADEHTSRGEGLLELDSD